MLDLRDVFNEKPSKEDIISATEETGTPRLYTSATIHTTFGDIHVELYAKVQDQEKVEKYAK